MRALLLLILALCGACCLGDEIQVMTQLGSVRGISLQSRLNQQFYAFRGIRYAEAPTGYRRFKNPVPVAAWKPDVFNATDDGPMCPQLAAHPNVISEDCLRLNVYTNDIDGCKPVIVYLHPGGFYFGSGQSKPYAGPQHMMDRDVVFVTINYRLGTLGFLATGTADAPGNAGLKDQVEALRWVRDHISNFGGNPNSVTLLGYSAGSLSIGLHMISPMSRGLFHRGIAMSASPLGQWDYNDKDMRLATKQARLLGCPHEPTTAMVECLREKPAIGYVRTMKEMFDFNWNPILNWLPIIEDDFGQEQFLIENPYKTIQQGNVYSVPLITGITEFEFLSAAHYDLQNDTVRKWFNEDFNKYAPIALMYERGTERSKNISSILREKYLKNSPLAYPQSLEAFGKLYSDAIIGFGYYRFVQLISRFAPVYTYLFTYKGRYSHFQYPANQTYGAVHHDELLYLLRVPDMTPSFKETDPENDTIERLTRIVFEFAKKSDPNNPKDKYLGGIHWKLYTEDAKDYMEIGEQLIPRTGGFYQERFELWNELFPVTAF